MQARVSILIDRPVSEVFTFVADPTKLPRWLPGVTSASAVGPVGVGTQVHVTASFQGRSGEADLEVTEFTRDDRVSFRASAPVRGHVSFAVRSDRDGTRLSVSGSAQLEGIASLASGIAEKAAEREMMKSLERLKGMLENRG